MLTIHPGIHPVQLLDPELRKEAGGFEKIIQLFIKHFRSGKFPDGLIPEIYDQSHCHLRFFLDRGSFVWHRYLQVSDQMKLRGFSYRPIRNIWSEKAIYFDQDYSPSPQGFKIIFSDLLDIVIHRQHLIYFGHPITFHHYFNSILNNSSNLKPETYVENQKSTRSDRGEEHQNFDLWPARDPQNQLRIYSRKAAAY